MYNLFLKIHKICPSRLIKSTVRDFTNFQLTKLEINETTGVATLTMNRPPVNSLNLELLRDIHQSIKEIESNNSRGLILTSSSTTVFSAGLDILEMHKPNTERLKDFWCALQDTWLALYGCAVPTAAAINGHSPAGGCLLALTCEFRTMLPNFTIGLNETKLGIVAPKWFMSSYLNVLPRHVAERALTQGKMFTTEEALEAGLVDAIAKNKEEAFSMCENFFTTFGGVNIFARSMTKKQFRFKSLQDLRDNRKQDLNTFLYFVNQPSIQKNLGIYIDSLKKKNNTIPGQ